VRKIVSLHPTPIVLHGGTGLTDDVFKRLIAEGCAKVNISTMLKITYCDAYRNYLDAKPDEKDPLKVMAKVREQLVTMAKGFMETFGSVGKAGTAQLAGQSHG
jgi:fructose-bisphosphate aldolase class II